MLTTSDATRMPSILKVPTRNSDADVENSSAKAVASTKEMAKAIASVLMKNGRGAMYSEALTDLVSKNFLGRSRQKSISVLK